MRVLEGKRGREEGKGSEFIGKKYCIRAAREDRKARERDGEHEQMKDDEGIVLYLLWHDHRPLRIVNVDDCECHRLWDIGDWEGRASRKRSPGERKGERRWWGGRTTSP